MLTRKQQWRRMKKVRRQQQPRSIIDLDLLASKKKRQLEGKPPQQPHQHAPCFGEDVEGEEDTGSSSSSSSSSFSCPWSSSDSLHDDGGSSSSSSSDDGDNDVDDSRAPATAPLPLDPTNNNNLVDPSSSSSAAGAAVAYGEAGAARPKGVSFQQEVQVFLVTHKSELDHSAKQALWWTGRDAAINKRAWLNHLGQPGCGRQSAVRPRKEPKQQQEDGGASNFLGAGRHTAAGRGRGIWSAHHGSNESDGYGGGAVMTGVGAGEEEGSDAAQLLPSSSPPPVSVGILGCRCDACLTEGDDHDQHQHHQQPRSDRSTPPHSYHPPPPPPPPHQRPVFDYNYNYRPPPSPVPSRSRYSGRPASKTWPSPADWARGDGDDGDGTGFSLGGRSRSYSPASARQGTSPLREACDSYDDDDDVFPRGSSFFDDDDDGGGGDYE